MKKFAFDVTTLIKCIEERPCLWDRRLASYKDRVERRTAWIEIYNILLPNYNRLSSEAQRNLAEIVLAKWTNVRDAFVKTVKKKSFFKRKQYVLYDNLAFLIDIIPGIEKGENDIDHTYTTRASIKEETSQIEEADEPERMEHQVYIFENPEVNSDDEEDVAPVTKPTPSKRRKVRKQQTKQQAREESPNKTPAAEVDVPIDDRVMNEDEAFFASLLPSVVKYSEEERLEFRIEVLAVMKRISDKRNMYN